MIQTTQGSLVLVGMNTATPQVFWNGQLVPGVTGIHVDNETDINRVVLKVPEDPIIAELKAAGITVRRVS